MHASIVLKLLWNQCTAEQNPLLTMHNPNILAVVQPQELQGVVHKRRREDADALLTVSFELGDGHVSPK